VNESIKFFLGYFVNFAKKGLCGMALGMAYDHGKMKMMVQGSSFDLDAKCEFVVNQLKVKVSHKEKLHEGL
jgi:hypothetical protein